MPPSTQPNTRTTHPGPTGRYGCLGDGTREDRLVPTRVLGLDGVTILQVACGWRHSIAVTDAHKLFTWGWGKFGQTGLGDTE